jgi:hypothetical protein
MEINRRDFFGVIAAPLLRQLVPPVPVSSPMPRARVVAGEQFTITPVSGSMPVILLEGMKWEWEQERISINPNGALDYGVRHETVIMVTGKNGECYGLAPLPAVLNS